MVPLLASSGHGLCCHAQHVLTRVRAMKMHPAPSISHPIIPLKILCHVYCNRSRRLLRRCCLVKGHPKSDTCASRVGRTLEGTQLKQSSLETSIRSPVHRHIGLTRMGARKMTGQIPFWTTAVGMPGSCLSLQGGPRSIHVIIMGCSGEYERLRSRGWR